MDIKNIIFDLGGVLLTDEDAGVLFDNEELKDKLKVDDETIRKVWDKIWKFGGEAILNEHEFYDLLQKELVGKSEEEFTKRLIEIYKDKTHILEPFNSLPKLKERYQLYTLTNITTYGLSFKRDKYKLDSIFDLIIASSEERLSKPDKKIFQVLLDRSGLNPAESVYVDDREKNTLVAQEFGFTTHVYKNIDDLLKFFSSVGIVYD